MPAIRPCCTVISALDLAGWVLAGAARLLNMTPYQIAYRLHTLNINAPDLKFHVPGIIGGL